MSKLFPKSANRLPLQIIILVFIVGSLVAAGTTYYATNSYTNVGYAPVQPVPFSHALHAGQLGIDCRYCHVGVDKSAVSSVPAAQTCMNCHNQVKPDSPLLQVVRDSYASGDPVPWVKIHQAPDYVYFNHAVHVNRGVSCVACHGHVNHMEVVYHAKPHSMGWCLECHRAPENHLRPLDQVTNLDWEPPAGTTQRELGEKYVKEWNVKPPVSCSGCHR